MTNNPTATADRIRELVPRLKKQYLKITSEDGNVIMDCSDLEQASQDWVLPSITPWDVLEAVEIIQRGIFSAEDFTDFFADVWRDWVHGKPFSEQEEVFQEFIGQYVK